MWVEANAYFRETATMRMTARWIASALLVIGLASAVCGADFYVDPQGSDTAPGTADRPFATLARAQKGLSQVAQLVPAHGEVRHRTYSTACPSGTNPSSWQGTARHSRPRNWRV